MPNEPWIPDLDRQEALTRRFLLSELADLEALFWDLRRRLDPALSQAQPSKLGKSYPLGQCLEISYAAEQLMHRHDTPVSPGAAARGRIALSAFMQHGGTVRQVWGDLRGQYFQNAFLVGTLYVDVSNDTVVVTKPSVEILAFQQANLRPVEDFRHFMRIGGSYWRAHFFPNHVLPTLAPYFPLIAAIPGGTLRFEPNSDYMVALTLAKRFRPSEEVLQDAPMTADAFRMAARRLAGSSLVVATDPEQGREQALRYCSQYRAQDRRFDDQHCKHAYEELRKASRCLDAIHVTMQD